MKNILTSVLFVVITITSFAQTNESSKEAHITFKGVPINGPLKEYISEMKSKGFVLIRENNGIAVFEGDFAGYRNCEIGVVTIKGKDLVSRAGVLFSEQDTWKDLSSNYFDLKELLSEKYGAPSQVVEEFNRAYSAKDDNDKMYEIKMNRYKYYSKFELENGSIQLSIENVDGSTYVRLMYYDKINGEISREKALEDL